MKKIALVFIISTIHSFAQDMCVKGNFEVDASKINNSNISSTSPKVEYSFKLTFRGEENDASFVANLVNPDTVLITDGEGAIQTVKDFFYDDDLILLGSNDGRSCPFIHQVCLGKFDEVLVTMDKPKGYISKFLYFGLNAYDYPYGVKITKQEPCDGTKFFKYKLDACALNNKIVYCQFSDVTDPKSVSSQVITTTVENFEKIKKKYTGKPGNFMFDIGGNNIKLSAVIFNKIIESNQYKYELAFSKFISTIK